MTGHRQLEIHQRLDMGAVEMEDALAEIKESKRGDDAGNPLCVLGRHLVR
jgi:hypothetical protein